MDNPRRLQQVADILSDVISAVQLNFANMNTLLNALNNTNTASSSM
jgi:hypothetical protein